MKILSIRELEFEKRKKEEEMSELIPVVEEEYVSEVSKYFTMNIRADLTTGSKFSFESRKPLRIPLKKNQSVIIKGNHLKIPNEIVNSLDWSQGDIIGFEIVDERLDAVEIVKVVKKPEDIRKTVEAFRKGKKE